MRYTDKKLATSSFDYGDIPVGYYDHIYREGMGVQSKWHHLKFDHVRHKLHSPNKLLDIGCGPGTFIGTLSNKINSFGVDISKTQINYANENYGSNSKVFIHNKTNTLPFENGYFDIVTILEVLEHVSPETAEDILKQGRRLLRADGTLIISTPNYKSYWPILEKLVDLFGEVQYGEQHITHYNPKSLKTVVAKSGFKKIDTEGMVGFAPFFAAFNWRLADRINKIKFNKCLSPLTLLTARK